MYKHSLFVMLVTLQGYGEIIQCSASSKQSAMYLLNQYTLIEHTSLVK